MRFSFAYQAGNGGRIDQHFIQADAPCLFSRRQPLGDNRLQTARQLATHQILLLGWKDVDQAIHRLRRAARMQRRQYQMTGFRRR